MKKMLCALLALAMALSMAACGGASAPVAAGEDGTTAAGEPATLFYGSTDYTRINPAMDEHCEINVLLFDGLLDHDGDNNLIPRLAKSWEYEDSTYTYTFHLEEGVKWHDGEDFTAEDVKFTIEAIMNPENGSENAPNYEDVEEITVVDPYTVSFRLAEPNYAFLEYMTMAILPKHLLEGENMQESDYFRKPVGTGPYILTEWDEGQAIIMDRNPDYFAGPAHIDRIICSGGESPDPAGGRTHHRPGCDHPGPDCKPFPAFAAGARLFHSVHRPRSCHGGIPVRPHWGYVPGQTGGGGPHRGVV